MKKQHNTWKIVLSCLLSIFIVLALFCGVMLYRLSKGMESIAQSFTQLETGSNSEGKNGVEISDDQKLIEFYQTLVNEISQYGDLDQTQEESARLMEMILERTIKNCQIQSVQYDTDGLVIIASGRGIAIDQLNESFLSKTAAKAALSYLKDNLGTAFSSIFKGEEGIKSLLYGGYANELLDTLASEIDVMPEQDVTYRIHVGIEDGKWLIRSLETSESAVLPESSSQDSSDSSQSDGYSSSSRDLPSSGKDSSQSEEQEQPSSNRRRSYGNSQEKEDKEDLTSQDPDEDSPNSREREFPWPRMDLDVFETDQPGEEV